MRNKGVKIILTTSLVLAVMFAVKLNNGGSSNDLDTNVSAEVSTATTSGVIVGVTEVIQQNMEQYQSAQNLYKVSTMKPTATKEPEITEEPIIYNDDSLIKSRDWDAKDSYLLAKIAMAEAEGEDVEGKAFVMLVVLNRVWTDEFPDTIHDVIYQKSQFSPMADGRFDRVEPNEECYEALEMVMSGWDESRGALYFESEKSADNWHSRHLDYLFTHGGHRFYK
jgi:N-acetylmuramoyl-L-alanine amidase